MKLKKKMTTDKELEEKQRVYDALLSKRKYARECHAYLKTTQKNFDMHSTFESAQKLQEPFRNNKEGQPKFNLQFWTHPHSERLQ